MYAWVRLVLLSTAIANILMTFPLLSVIVFVGLFTSLFHEFPLLLPTGCQIQSTTVQVEKGVRLVELTAFTCVGVRDVLHKCSNLEHDLPSIFLFCCFAYKRNNSFLDTQMWKQALSFSAPYSLSLHHFQQYTETETKA